MRPFELAERQGFEPWIRCRIRDFESRAFDHSAISPEARIIARRRGPIGVGICNRIGAPQRKRRVTPPFQDMPRRYFLGVAGVDALAAAAADGAAGAAGAICGASTCLPIAFISE